LWDINGVIEPVDDPDLARAVLNKVNDMNLSVVRDCFLVSLLWTILPSSTSEHVSIVALSFATLYFLKDRIPKDV